jgi:hypothetical protein
MGNKEGDQCTVGLCRRHHTEEHRIGQSAFEAEYGIDLVKLAREFAAASPDRAIRETVKPKEKAQ